MTTMPRYQIFADGVPLRPDDILALMPAIEREFILTHAPTLLAGFVVMANLLHDKPLSQSSGRQARPRKATNSKPKRKPPRGVAAAAVAEALRQHPRATLSELATMTGYSRSYVCDLRRQLRETDV